jgi:HlyD family secretion protein
MQVKVTVHESKVESIRAGMPASVRIQNRRLTGYVTSVANQPESTMMFSSGVKKYAAYVRIDGEQADLKPGMTAEVKILIDERRNVLTVPVQCVAEIGGKFYVWKLVGGEVQKTPVVLGTGDDQNVEVKEGLAENDVVLQNPPERQAGALSATSDSRGQFGAGRPAGTGAPPGGPAGSGGAGGGGAGGGARSGRGMGDLMALDKDGDKKISRAEAPEQMQAFFDRIDGDGDGFITDAEAKAAAARRAASGGAPPQ